MKPFLRTLIVDDSENDALLLLNDLEKSDYQIVHKRVDTAEGLCEALDHESWDIIFCDFTMPGLTGARRWKSRNSETLICHLFSFPGRLERTLPCRQ